MTSTQFHPSATAANQGDDLLSLSAVAAYLGIGKRTFCTWRSAGRPPVPDLHVGRTLRWRRSTIERWLAEDKVKRLSA